MVLGHCFRGLFGERISIGSCHANALGDAGLERRLLTAVPSVNLSAACRRSAAQANCRTLQQGTWKTLRKNPVDFIPPGCVCVPEAWCVCQCQTTLLAHTDDDWIAGAWISDQGEKGGAVIEGTGHRTRARDLPSRAKHERASEGTSLVAAPILTEKIFLGVKSRFSAARMPIGLHSDPRMIQSPRSPSVGPRSELAPPSPPAQPEPHPRGVSVSWPGASGLGTIAVSDLACSVSRRHQLTRAMMLGSREP